ncbi:MAG TPA: ABC transporter ATP-binding protein [Verrucomicrobiae bacterium]|nr:ABC transporter ATP-binding protein [Verrucomicrobiae bacterium]
MIQLNGVTKTYKIGDETLHALNNISLAIKEGEFVAITGPSGSGKSTLANIIGGLDNPDSGTVMVEGEDLSQVNDKHLSEYRNKHIGFVFQSFNLQPNYTATENVMMPLVFGRVGKRTRYERAVTCLKMVGLGDRLRHLPSQLSGGQRQRVSIARALANEPSIIIADEPTGNLDSSRGEEILALLKNLNEKGKTLIIITHDQSIAKQADRVITIHDGKMTERAN